jgi:hypothetical protein
LGKKNTEASKRSAMSTLFVSLIRLNQKMRSHSY